jgi:protein transport protein SEC61 subunit gamma and related proteins
MQAFSKLGSFILECRRVLRVTKRPSSSEFKTIAKVSGLGIIAIGMIGFLISLIRQLGQSIIK